MKIISITHANDIDGIGSAALIKMKYGISSDRIFFSDYSEENVSYVQKSVFKLLRKESGTLVFLTDLSMNRILVKGYIKMIKEVKKRGGKVVWFDHHLWGEEEVRRVASLCDFAVVGENHKYCGAEITKINLGIDTKFTNELIKIIHCSDFNLKPKNKKWRKLIGTYAMSIGLYIMFYDKPGLFKKRDNALRHIVDLIASGRFVDPVIIRDSKKFDKINKARMSLMIKRLYKVTESVYMGFSEGVQSTQGGSAIINKSGADIAIYVNTTTCRAHLRSVKGDTTILSRHFGGGGHPHASSFKIDAKRFNNFKTEKDRTKFVEFIGRIMRRLYKGAVAR